MEEFHRYTLRPITWRIYLFTPNLTGTHCGFELSLFKLDCGNLEISTYALFSLHKMEKSYGSLIDWTDSLIITSSASYTIKGTSDVSPSPLCPTDNS